MGKESNIMTTVTESVVTKIAGIAIDSFVSYIKGKFSEKNVKPVKSDFEKNICLHFNEIYNWSKEIEFVGLSHPISVLKNTIELSFYFSLLYSDKISVENTGDLNEDDILISDGNIIIEGNPGSGKTTTLKRLIYNYFFSDNNKKSEFYYPLLIRFRAIESYQDLHTHICHLLGIEYETKKRIVKQKVKYTEDVVDKKTLKKKKIERYKTVDVEEMYHQVSSIDLDIFIAELLDENRVLIILDGLDELNPDILTRVNTQLMDLSRRIIKAKTIITSRPNYIENNFYNCNYYQINELSERQMFSIAELWITNSNDFFSQLRNKSYFELANRPLFLSYLLVLYSAQSANKVKYLPRSSKEVYEQIIELLLIRWDKGRGITRMSKYSYFDPKKKLEFLSDLSFNLTYVIRQKEFTHDQLINVYKNINDKFDLPIDEADQVARELESHTGIIISSFYKKYEFSHLAIQEYLCALHIVTAPFNSKIAQYLSDYPAPLAVAVSLSSDPTMWLSNLVEIGGDTKTYTRILDRLYIESPFFRISRELGLAILRMCKRSNCKDADFMFYFERLLDSNTNIFKSLEDLLKDVKNVHVVVRSPVTNRITFWLKDFGPFGEDPYALPMTFADKHFGI